MDIQVVDTLPRVIITMQPLPGEPGAYGPRVDIQNMPRGWRGAHEVLVMALGLVVDQMLKPQDMVQIAHPSMVPNGGVH